MGGFHQRHERRNAGEDEDASAHRFVLRSGAVQSVIFARYRISQTLSVPKPVMTFMWILRPFTPHSLVGARLSALIT